MNNSRKLCVLQSSDFRKKGNDFYDVWAHKSVASHLIWLCLIYDSYEGKNKLIYGFVNTSFVLLAVSTVY